jgi:hypothetical protein
MEAPGKFITWFTSNAQTLSIIVAILIAVVPAVWSFIKYLDLKNKELRHERFKIYTSLFGTWFSPIPRDRQCRWIDKLQWCLN